MLIIVPAFLPLIAYAAGLEYLRRALLPSAPTTTPVSEPYTPPFTGGQCAAPYRGILDVRMQSNPSQRLIYSWGSGGTGSLIAVGANPPVSSWGSFTVNGKITGATFDFSGGVYRFFVNGIYVASRSSAQGVVTSVAIAGLALASGGADNCGDLPNPSPAPPVASDGLADSPAPSITGDELVVSGSPIVPYNPLTAVISAILAALKAASDLKDAIDFIGDMLDKIGRGIDDVKDWLDDKNKNPDSGKDVKRHDYGSIGKDGFLRLYPNGENNGYKPLYIDLQLLSIPVGYGKYFGDKSPHFYRFKSLGYISFVSSTFGVLETHEVEFSRASLQVPELAYGFFYHLGLEDVIRANVSLFYLIDKPVE